MCQLTLIDFSSQRIAKHTIKHLSVLNHLGVGTGSNHDGFGCMLFSNGVITKSEKSSYLWWWEDGNKFLEENRNVNGIYHVRAASISNSTTKNKKEYSHPFELGNLVLAHNGTLDFIRYGAPDTDEIEPLINIKDKDFIDSQEFLIALNYLMGNSLLTANHIKTAMKNFYGVFAFLIYDKRQPKDVFVVRSSGKKLFKLEIKIEDKPWGILINTGEFELEYISDVILSLCEVAGIKNIDFIKTEVPKESIHLYKIGSFVLNTKLDKIEETTRVYKTPASSSRSQMVPYSGSPSNNYSAYKKNESYIEELVAFMKSSLFTLSEFNLLAELIYGKTIYVFEKSDMKEFSELLGMYKKVLNGGRKKAWRDILGSLNKKSGAEFYKKTGIEFPWFLNSKKELQKARNKWLAH